MHYMTPKYEAQYSGEMLIIEEPSFAVYIIKIITRIWCYFSQPFLWDWDPIIPKKRLFSQDNLSVTGDAYKASGRTLSWFSPDKRIDVQGHVCWAINKPADECVFANLRCAFLVETSMTNLSKASCLRGVSSSEELFLLYVHYEWQSWPHFPLCLDCCNSHCTSCNFVAGIYRINLVC